MISRRPVLVLAIVPMLLLGPVVAQEEDPDQQTGVPEDVDAQADLERPLSRPTDDHRKCGFPEDQPQIEDPLKPTFRPTSWGNNPQEGVYEQEMRRLLTLELNNVNRAIADVVAKHGELIRLYPHLRYYHEITLEDKPGEWVDGQYINSQKLIIFHYTPSHEVECIVMDSFSRNIYMTNQYTRKTLRLYYPNIQSMEMHTLKHGYDERGRLDNASPEVQLKALRLIFLNLRTALYTMDMYIASYYNNRNKVNAWQIDI